MNVSKTILVIDDDKKFSFGLVAVLRKAGYKVISASNGIEGFAAIERERPDLILCDIMMPPPNGIQLKRMLSTKPNIGEIPFLFVTARIAQMDKLAGLDNGADDYITKPFDVNELLLRIQAVLRRGELGRQRGIKDMNVVVEKLRTSISSNLSHELRTPLTILLATLDLVVREKFTEENSDLAQYIKRASASAYRLKFLIEDLEALYYIDQDKVSTFRQEIDPQFALKESIDQILKMWEEKSVTNRYFFNPATVIYAPRQGFSHTIAHLVDNACKFSPENGEVQISIQPNGWGGCVIEVTDQGKGIPLGLREKVFERYYQISQGDDRQYGGLGVGLTIARNFARAQGGDIQFIDHPAGCKVQFTLPSLEE